MSLNNLKDKHVVIGIPYYKEVPPEFSMNLVRTGRHLRSFGATCDIIYRRGALIYKQRNDLSRMALNYGATHLMFIDTDMEFDPQSVARLLSHGKDIVGGVYIMRGGIKPIVYYKNRVNIGGNFSGVMSSLYIPRKVHQVAALGTGFMLIDMKVIEHMWKDENAEKYGYPFNVWQTPKGNQIGEDLSFCHRAMLHGFTVWADPLIRLGHQSSVSVWCDLLHADLSKGRHYCNDIDGWMSVSELNWLYQRAKLVGRIVEVGAWKGRSTHALLSACPGEVIAVDHWHGSEGEKQGPHKEAAEDPEKVFTQFANNVGKFKNLRILRMSSLEAAKEFEDESVDMVFIDAEHSTKAVKQDIEAWFPKCSWMLCGHDFNYKGVREAVRECFPVESGYEVKVFDTIWYVEKTENWDKGTNFGYGEEEEKNG